VTGYLSVVRARYRLLLLIENAQDYEVRSREPSHPFAAQPGVIDFRKRASPKRHHRQYRAEKPGERFRPEPCRSQTYVDCHSRNPHNDRVNPKESTHK
jgi:hypothetical protein